ncbi:helix-turn-helix transcriptional regulator [Macrococcus epidermidis]|uniref:helix-turn-helix transcriptional regulator n=1 Tax=Macrococcus epidermidis TaxID=1902580 RepID=UPI0020B64A68|nr:helix-turn-helix transcriptional regulator [Macrococcus epidermidis]UTH16957.1 helix-turn-helix transcriptional regulator [Macrococcus epidermidis]
MSKHWQLYILRSEAGKSQKDMAKLLGISPNRYLLRENMKADFSLPEAQKLAEYFNVSLDELFPPKNVKEVG